MEYCYKCPKCSNLSCTETVPVIGQHLLCPYCHGKFSFLIKHLVGYCTESGLVKFYSPAELRAVFSKCGVNSKFPYRNNVLAPAETPPAPAAAPVVEADAEPNAGHEPPSAEVQSSSPADVHDDGTVPLRDETPPAPAAAPVVEADAEPNAGHEPPSAEVQSSSLADVHDAGTVPLRDETPPAPAADFIGKCQGIWDVSDLETRCTDQILEMFPKNISIPLIAPDEICPAHFACLISQLPTTELIAKKDISPPISDSVCVNKFDFPQNFNDGDSLIAPKDVVVPIIEEPRGTDPIGGVGVVEWLWSSNRKAPRLAAQHADDR